MRRTAQTPKLTHIPADARRALGYVRVSTEEQAENGMSLDTQEAAIRAYADRNGIHLIEVIRDAGFSAFSRKKRPGFTQLLQRMDECDLVLVWRTDRFGRRNREIQNSVGDLLDSGKGFISTSEGFDLSTPDGRLMFNFHCSLAQHESERLQSRVLPNVRASVVDAGLHHGHPPYGYRILQKGVREVMTPCPMEAPVAKRIFTEYRAGASLYAIARGLNGDAIPSPRGRDWSSRGVRVVLQNPAYIGTNIHSPSGFVGPGLHEPLVDVELFEACQRRLRRNKSLPARSRGGSLGALVRCGHCGAGMRLMTGGGGPTYVCRRYVENPNLHPRLAIQQFITHQYIWGLVQEALGLEGKKELALRWTLRQDQPDETLQCLREECAQLEADIEYNTTQARMSKLPHRLLAKMNEPLIERLAEIEQEIGSLEIEEPKQTILELQAEYEAMRRADYEHQRTYLSHFFAAIEVYDDSLRFIFKDQSILPVRIKRHCIRGLRHAEQSRLPVEIIE